MSATDAPILPPGTWISSDALSPPAFVVAPFFVYAMLLGIEILRSGQHVLLKLASQSTNPLLFAFLRDVIATAALLVGSFFDNGTSIPMLHQRHIYRAMAMGFTGVFSNQLLFLFGLRHSSPSIAAILQGLVPIWTCLVVFVSGAEFQPFRGRVGTIKLASIFLSTIGASLMIICGGESLSGSWDSAFFVLNSLSMAIFLVLQKPLLRHYRPSVVALYAYSSALALMFFVAMPVAIFANMVHVYDIFALSGTTWIALFYSGVVASAFVVYATAWATVRISSVIIGAFFLAQVLTTSFLSLVVLHIWPSWSEVLCSVPILVGLGLLCWAHYREQQIPFSEANTLATEELISLMGPLVQRDGASTSMGSFIYENFISTENVEG